MAVKYFLVLVAILSLTHHARADEMGEDALKCSALFYVATAIPEYEQLSYSVMMMKAMYGDYVSAKTGRVITKGDTNKAQDKVLQSLGELYDSNPKELTPMYVRCELWRFMIAEYMSSINFYEEVEKMSDEEVSAAFAGIPAFPKTEDISAFIDDYEPTIMEIFQKWSDAGRMTAFTGSQMLREMAEQIEREKADNK